MLSSVLVGLVGTKYANAVVDTALEVAANNKAPVTAITAVDMKALQNVGPVPIGAGEAARELREHRIQVTHEAIETAIKHFEARCQELGIEYSVKQEEREEPYNFLISRSRYHDLTVLSLRGIFEYDIRSAEEADASVTLVRLITQGVRPILAVPAEHRPIKRVFCAYSGSIESAATLRRFIQLRPYQDFELCIATFEMDEARSQRLLHHASRYCQKNGIEPETVHVAKTAKEHLLEEAREQGADLIVLGNSAKNLLMRRVLGETALRAIRESEVPLFLSQ